MKLSFLVLVLGLAIAAPAVAEDVYVEGYVRSNGTYVEPYYRSSPNDTVLDNWSTKGNVNPYTGEPGTRNPYSSSNSYSSGNSNRSLNNGATEGFDGYGNPMPRYY